MSDIALEKGKPFDWFGTASFDKIADEIDEVKGQPGRRLEIHEYQGKPVIRIVSDAYAGPPTNDSFRCPPICP